MQILRTYFICLRILPPSDQKKFRLVVVAQAALGILDLFGVAVLGIIGAMSIRGVQSQPPSEKISKILDAFGLNSLSLQQQVAILGFVAGLMLVVRTLLSMYFTWKIINFLSSRSAEISTALISKFLASGMSSRANLGVSEIQYILGPGVSAISVGVLGSFSTLLSDLSTLIIIGIGVFVLDPVTAILSFLIFATIAIVLSLLMNKKAQQFGKDLSDLNIQSNKLLSQMIIGYREVYVRNRRHHYLNEITGLKRSISRRFAQNAFMPNIGKYVIEISVVIGGGAIAATQFMRSDAMHAAASLSIFIAAGTRIAPALLRIQQSILGIKSNSGLAELTIEVLREFDNQPRLAANEFLAQPNEEKFVGRVEIQNLSYCYPAQDKPALEISKLTIPEGTSFAIVGPSGAGKTTFADLILGVIEVKDKEVLISGQNPGIAIEKWPGSISYVPQEILIIEGTFAENVAFGFHKSEIDEQAVWEALRYAQLEDFIAEKTNGIWTRVEERGVGLSGGQRQRLGIARALYLKPKLLVLDEATSALDGKLEDGIATAISTLRSKVTTIIIAHRLSTIKNVDTLLYVDKGKIIATGTFDNVRNQVTDFDEQAKLMGL
jgi:ABC-type multidrug transport system fused ATPase/permease subunit